MSAGRCRFRATWSCVCTIPNWATIRAMPRCLAKRATFTRPAMCTRCSVALWRVSSTRCGGCWDRQGRSKFWNLVRAAGYLPKMCWIGRRKSSPDSFTLRTTGWWRRSPALRQRLQATLGAAFRGEGGPRSVLGAFWQ